jgi:hypothetical protein
MKHLGAVIASVSIAVAAASAGAAPASAAPAEHAVIVENYDAYEHLAAAENFCGPWPTTFHEVRAGAYQLITPPGGRVNDEIHINGAINGQIELIPDDASLPTYTGGYREKLNGVITGVSEHGDITRVAQYRLRSTLRGSDGSTLDLRLSGKVTMNANDVVVVSRDSFSCQ